MSDSSYIALLLLRFSMIASGHDSKEQITHEVLAEF